ncbi:MAG: hypothetical protein ABID61_03110 [Candidatus Micrarchaeota archaeon]
MTSLKSVALLLLLSGLIFAFNLSPYFFADEANVTVTYSNFSLDDDNYSIVQFDGVDTFLLKNNNMITEEAEINSAIYTHYMKTYYPTQDEIDDLLQTIKKFNDSRNDGYDFKNKEEYICRDDILLSNGKISVFGQPVRCLDNESCMKNAMLLFSVYGEGLGLGSPTTLMDPLFQFTPSSIKMDLFVANYTDKLTNLDEDSLVDTLNYIKTTSTELKPLSEKIEYSIFRTPKLNDTADRAACQFKCMAICPSIDIDQGAADDVVSKSTALVTKVAPLQNFNSSAIAIYDETQSRIEYATNTAIAENYTKIFKSFNQSANDTITLAKETISHVLDPVLSQKLASLQSLHTSIPLRISQRNFTTLDSDIIQYKNLTIVVSNMTDVAMDQYTRTLNAKNIENSVIMVLETKDLDPITLSSLNVLINQTYDLNAQFRDGLTIDELVLLEGNYTDLTLRAQNLLQNEQDSPSKKAVSMFRGFARRVNVGIASLADNTNFINRAEIPDNPWVLAIFSLVTFLSFTSLVLLAFLYLFAVNNFRVPKTNHLLAAALLSVLVLLFLFSTFMFVFLGKTSSSATLTEFMADFEPKESAVIMVDLRNVTLSDAEAMQTCAEKLADSLGSKNKTWTIYTVTPSTCTIANGSNTSTAATSLQCINNTANSPSSFILGHSDTSNSIRLSIIYKNSAEITANKQYYTSCPLVSMFG